jgi:hypothetical protein
VSLKPPKTKKLTRNEDKNMFGNRKEINWEKWDKEVSDELYVLLKEEIRTTLDQETTDWIDSHSNRKMKIFIHGNVDRRYKTYAQNLLIARERAGFDDSVCKYQ